MWNGKYNGRDLTELSLTDTDFAATNALLSDHPCGKSMRCCKDTATLLLSRVTKERDAVFSRFETASIHCFCTRIAP